MRKAVRMMLSLVLSATLLAGAPGLTLLAAETSDLESVESTESSPEMLKAEIMSDTDSNMPYTMLYNCIISVSGDDEAMHIDITTNASGMASVIGVKDVKIMKKVWYGWSTVAVSDGGESQNRSMMGISIPYANAVKDATYRITCVHYADVNGYTEGENDTGAFVYTY